MKRTLIFTSTSHTLSVMKSIVFCDLDGYTPEEIMYAFHRKMDREQAEREALEKGFDSIKVKSEVKLKK